MWENSTKSKYVEILMNNQNIMFGYTPPMEKNRKIEKYQTIYLMNVENNVFDIPLST